MTNHYHIPVVSHTSVLIKGEPAFFRGLGVCDGPEKTDISRPDSSFMRKSYDDDMSRHLGLSLRLATIPERKRGYYNRRAPQISAKGRMFVQTSFKFLLYKC